MLASIAGSTKYFEPLFSDDGARTDMHYDGQTLAVVFDPSGLYSQGARFTWWDFVYTNLAHFWADGTLFHLTPANGSEERYLRIDGGQAIDVATGERLLMNYGNQQWEFAHVAERLWSRIKFDGGAE